MYFLRSIIFHFPSLKKISYFREKEIPSYLSSWYKKDHILMQFFWIDHLFRTFEEYIIFLCISFWERSSFIFHLKNNIIFSGKRNIIFPDDTRKIIFQCDFFGKIIFQNIWKKKRWFFVQCFKQLVLRWQVAKQLSEFNALLPRKSKN